VNDERLNIRVGLALLAAIAAAVGVVFGLSGRSLAAVHEYHVDFTRIGGLKTGAKVLLSGREVGQVKDIRFAQRGFLRVDIWVRRSFRPFIHQNSEFYVGMGGSILGEPSLDIGPPRGGVAPGPELLDGAVVRGIDPPKLDDVLSKLYQNLQSITEELKQDKDVIDPFLHDLDHLLATLDDIHSEPGAITRIRDNVNLGTVAALDLIAALRRGTDDGVRIRATAQEVSRLWTRTEKEMRTLGPRFDRAQAGLARLQAVFSPSERARISKTFETFGKAADIGANVAHEIACLADYVQSGRGTFGALLNDNELVDDIKVIHQMLKDKPWMTLAKPEKPRRE
jgi:phospholipid/cholesterol/gamma-HCH transport system substrate-binding protein